MNNPWIETEKVLEKKIWEVRNQEKWFDQKALSILEANDKLKFIYEQPKPVAILLQIVIQGLHPDGLGFECLKRKNHSEDTNKIILMSENSFIAAYNLEGSKVFEGVLRPQDHELILKFAVNHFFVILDEKN